MFVSPNSVRLEVQWRDFLTRFPDVISRGQKTRFPDAQRRDPERRESTSKRRAARRPRDAHTSGRRPRKSFRNRPKTVLESSGSRPELAPENQDKIVSRDGEVLSRDGRTSKFGSLHRDSPIFRVHETLRILVRNRNFSGNTHISKRK